MMNEAEWLEERRKGIGASDIAAVMGVSRWKTPYQVYLEKRKEANDFLGNKIMDWGKRMEGPIRQWYSDTTGRTVIIPQKEDGTPKILYHAKYPFLLASLDGYTEAAETRKSLLDLEAERKKNPIKCEVCSAKAGHDVFFEGLSWYHCPKCGRHGFPSIKGEDECTDCANRREDAAEALGLGFY